MSLTHLQQHHLYNPDMGRYQEKIFFVCSHKAFTINFLPFVTLSLLFVLVAVADQWQRRGSLAFGCSCEH